MRIFYTLQLYLGSYTRKKNVLWKYCFWEMQGIKSYLHMFKNYGYISASPVCFPTAKTHEIQVKIIFLKIKLLL